MLKIQFVQDGMNWWELVPAAVGAILGAAAAAIPALWLARMASKETLERDRAARHEQQKAAAFRALVKLLTIINGIGDLHRYIEGAIKVAADAGHSNLRLWQQVQPMTGLSDSAVRFDADDLVALVSANEFDYVTSLLELAERRVSLEGAFRDYTILRKRLTDRLAAMITEPMQGQLAGFQLTKEEAIKLEPFSVELEALVSQMRTLAAKNYASALALGRQFGPKVRGALADKDFPNLGDDQGSKQLAGGAAAG